jgi:hypothetical protein
VFFVLNGLIFSGKFDCALFGEYVDIMKKLMESAGAGMPVIVVQFAKIKVFRGMCSSHVMFLIICIICI